MRPGTSRRRFLEAASLGVAMAGGSRPGHGAEASPAVAGAQGQAGPLPKVAALASVYFYLSHAYHIVGRFLDGFPVYDAGPSGSDAPGYPLHKPPFQIASLYIEQTPEATDLGKAKARRH